MLLTGPALLHDLVRLFLYHRLEARADFERLAEVTLGLRVHPLAEFGESAVHVCRGKVRDERDGLVEVGYCRVVVALLPVGVTAVVVRVCVIGLERNRPAVVINRACVVAEGVLCDAAVAVDFGGVWVDGKYLVIVLNRPGLVALLGAYDRADVVSPRVFGVEADG